MFFKCRDDLLHYIVQVFLFFLVTRYIVMQSCILMNYEASHCVKLFDSVISHDTMIINWLFLLPTFSWPRKH